MEFVNRGDEYRCPACGAGFPLVNGVIPVFLENPSAGENFYGSMFRERAACYDADFQVDEGHGEWVLRRLLELEPSVQESAESVLEIGAGTGHLTRSLAAGQILPFGELAVSDLSAEMLLLNWQKRRDAERRRPIEYMACNVQQLPFPDSSLSLVIGLDVLHHVLDYRSALGELRRVLKPGGVCVVKEPHRAAYLAIAFLARILVRMDRGYWPGQGLTLRDRRRLTRYAEHVVQLIACDDRGDYAALAAVDDKYFFDPDRLSRQARDAGFSRFTEANVLYRPGLDVPYGPMILDTFRGAGISARGLSWIARTTSTLDATIGPHLLQSAPINTLFLCWA